MNVLNINNNISKHLQYPLLEKLDQIRHVPKAFPRYNGSWRQSRELSNRQHHYHEASVDFDGAWSENREKI